MNKSYKNTKENNVSDYSGILHQPEHSDKILNMTADTMFMVTHDGICVDIVLHSDRWFLQNTESIIGHNIFELLPSETALALRYNFNKVLSTGEPSSENYELIVAQKKYFFKCIVYRYSEELILCQYRDITQRILLKKKLEIMNRKFLEIEKVAQISQWIYNSKLKQFQYAGFSGGIAIDGDTHHISLEHYLEMIHPFDQEDFRTFIENGMQIDTENTIVYRVFMNQKLYHFRFKNINTYYEDGTKFVNGYVQNISDIMKNKHDLEIVTLAIQNSSDYIFAMKPDGQLIYGNQKFKDFNHINLKEDLTRHNFFDIKKSHINKSKWRDIIQQLTATNQTLSFIEGNPLPEKPDILAFDCTSYLIQDSLGYDLIWTFGKDMTDRIQYEKQVKELNQIMSTVLNNIPMSISVKDINDDFKYIFSNQIGDEYNWAVKDGMIGKTDFEIFPEDQAQKMRDEDLINSKSESECRKIIEDTDEYGVKQIRDQLRILVKDETRPLLISIERDITKDKIMEQDLINAKEKAEESDKLKSAFIANISHEIRTPLNAIVGFSRIISETESSNERQEYFSIVDENNTRLLGLINEILDISKIESGIVEFNEEPMNLHALCQDVLHTNALRCANNCKLVFDDCDRQLIIKSDKGRLTQVFNNLIGNAVKYTKEGFINFGYIQKEDYIECYVKDTGSGIDAENLDRVFERFVKTDSYTQGTGLGLSICKSIVERMGGHISVRSTKGVGSIFYFRLPIQTVVKHMGSGKSGENSTPMEAQKKGLILVAEDTDSNYILLVAMIGKDFDLKRAKNGLEVVNMFEELQPDLILMDIKMPIMSGLDAVKIIRTISVDVPIIAQSAFAFEQDRQESLKSGCNDFLAKPFKKKQLMEIIHKYLK